MQEPLRGVFAAVMTPLREDLTVDANHLAAHCQTLLDEGCHGVSLFGTTGEGPGFTAEERMAALEAVIAAGIEPTRILPGTGCVALPDTIRLTRHAIGLGCTNILLMPPFFFKEPSDEGVFQHYKSVIDGVNDANLRVYIYNFPAVTGVWIHPGVVERLIGEFPDAIAGVKDSSGDWDYVNALLTIPGLAVFSGWEMYLPKLLAAGGSGNISGLANVIAPTLRRLYDTRPADPKHPLMTAITELVGAVVQYPGIPAIRALAANLRDDPTWRRIRPPLSPLDPQSETALMTAFEKAMDGNHV
ncbi:MAG: dihydrodipicolinate synthase family protein [Rhodospirillales bacterium]|jgi:4-hydroxy-tetrahydrodipicolinate synthase|nr:dihydrodipicolinate synthase family protein [Rhodospirillales bacterium]